MGAMFTFSEDARSWVSGAANGAQPVHLQRLRVATYNVWFDPFEARKRCFALLELLAAEAPDVIALQEVTQPFLDALLREPWVRQSYGVSCDHLDLLQRRYDVVMLSRLPATFVADEFTTTMGRRLHRLTIKTSAGDLTIAGCHLESMREMAHVRLTQIDEALPIFERTEHAIWMGDFNAAADTAECARIRSAFRDAWCALHGAAPGYTRDTSTNKMLARVKDDRHQRIDRIFVKGPAITPVAMRLLGTAPLSGESDDVFPSDHYGLAADFSFAP